MQQCLYVTEASLLTQKCVIYLQSDPDLDQTIKVIKPSIFKPRSSFSLFLSLSLFLFFSFKDVFVLGMLNVKG